MEANLGMTTMISSASFLSLGEALAMEHGSEVSLFAVIASVGPVTSRCSNQLPYCTSEICLKDPRLVWYTSYNHSYFIDIY
jgi:hypothetical protein